MKRLSVSTLQGQNQILAMDFGIHSVYREQLSNAENKLLHLRDSLWNLFESLGNSAAAYEAAKKRLERTFGEERIQVNGFLEERSYFPAIKYENAKNRELIGLFRYYFNMKDTDTRRNSVYLHVTENDRININPIKDGYKKMKKRACIYLKNG